MRLGHLAIAMDGNAIEMFVLTHTLRERAHCPNVTAYGYINYSELRRIFSRNSWRSQQIVTKIASEVARMTSLPGHENNIISGNLYDSWGSMKIAQRLAERASWQFTRTTVYCLRLAGE